MTKAVATKEDASTAVAAFDPSMFEQDAGSGNENIGQDDLALPFLKIISGLDPLLDDIEELRKGDIYNTVTGDIYKGKEGVRVIPCAYQRRFIEWAPRGQGSGAPVNIFTPDEERPPHRAVARRQPRIRRRRHGNLHRRHPATFRSGDQR
jgi:hypothetical protein